jgi:uncharacterized protein (TIGR01319 family)
MSIQGQVYFSIDIGSTFTKGAAFSAHMQNDSIKVLSYHQTPTTVSDLSICFKSLLSNLCQDLGMSIHDINPDNLVYSSSAKGGLSVTAIGLVKDLTLEIAKQAAYSAGAKIQSVFSYKISEQDIEKINENPPDIILLSGGTNGGNETYILHNANMLARLKEPSIVLFAGNQAVLSEVKARLGDKHEFVATENLLPELDNPNIEPIREKIREIFLRRIVFAKNLDKIIAEFKKEPLPTPYSVFEFVKLIPSLSSKFQKFALVDMGGATTDYYSFLPFPESTEANIFLKGTPPQCASRTVEGDLGLWVSRQSTWENFLQFKTWHRMLPAHVQSRPELPAEIDALGLNHAENNLDFVLAYTAFSLSQKRHAGVLKPVHTVHGTKFVQYGKDLRGIDSIILSGGFLSKISSFDGSEKIIKDALKSGDQFSTDKEIALTPNFETCYIDKNYLFPILSNLSRIPKLQRAAVEYLENNFLELSFKTKQG